LFVFAFNKVCSNVLEVAFSCEDTCKQWNRVLLDDILCVGCKMDIRELHALDYIEFK
jgi:hypothetical protein